MLYLKNYRESLFQFGIPFLVITYKVQDKYPIGCHCGSSHESWFCSRSTPTPSELAPTFNLVGKFGSKIFRMEADVIEIFNYSIASNWVFYKLNVTSFFKSTRSGVVTSARFGMNLWRQFTIPKNLWSSVMDCSKDIFIIASVLKGSTLTPFEEIICPKNANEFLRNWHLFLLSYKPPSLTLSKTL